MERGGFNASVSDGQSERRALRLARLRDMVRNVQPEVGPGGLFKIAYLGSRSCPLDPDEYRRRHGHRFTTAATAVQIVNGPESLACLRVELRGVMTHEPSIVIRLKPGSHIWFPFSRITDSQFLMSLKPVTRHLTEASCYVRRKRTAHAYSRSYVRRVGRVPTHVLARVPRVSGSQNQDSQRQPICVTKFCNPRSNMRRSGDGPRT